MKLSGYKGQRLNRKDKGMKLRNKKTGEIIEVCKVCPEPFGARDFDCNSLAELNERWEDYEEPKEHWYIDWDGKLMVSSDEEGWKAAISIGNYFETKEEAEKAVEKLKAWKRLKDKGFSFIEGRLDNNDDFIIKAKLGYVGLIDRQDIHLLFGGEDE